MGSFGPLTDSAGHHTADGLGDLERMSDGVRIDQLVRDLLMRCNDSRILASHRHRGVALLIDRLEGVFCEEEGNGDGFSGFSFCIVIPP